MSKLRVALLLVSALMVGATVGVAPVQAQGIGPGLDLMTTNPTTTFVDLGGLFGPPFQRVQLRGVPFGTDMGLRNTDTIVFRSGGINPFPIGGTGTVPIELLALNLRSVQPIDLFGMPADLWITRDSYGIFPGRIAQPAPPQFAAFGSMTARRESATGGTFTSELFVSGNLIFTRAGGDPLNPQDIIFAFEVPIGYIQPLRPQQPGVWGQQPTPGYPDLFSGRFYVQTGFVELAQLVAHGVIPAN